ncbi:SCO family protein [Methylobacter sp. YRD-M1]|uniref:SCO family protein n=1 Tax=Methylobacter sp. YRD-M1 TaxID=2911520 RepID=UPI00227AC81F|nr:SCO family protein [Methylobacter sp. YRD-M1]WAK01110.1 SCO family protein [Methylobacter sp. YRD-M1]
MAQQKFFRLAKTPTQFFLWAAIFFPVLVLLSLAANWGAATEAGASETDKPSLSVASRTRPYQRSEHRYMPNDFELTDRNGNKVKLHQALGNEHGVMLNFIFTSCTTVCPLMSASFAQVQQQLGPEREKVRLISISIDPDHDTPQRLTDYWHRFGAGPQWQLLTGRRDDVIEIQKAFEVYRGKKANHQSVTLLKGSPNGPWVRLEGYAGAADIIREYDSLSGH